MKVGTKLPDEKASVDDINPWVIVDTLSLGIITQFESIYQQCE